MDDNIRNDVDGVGVKFPVRPAISVDRNVEQRGVSSRLHCNFYTHGVKPEIPRNRKWKNQAKDLIEEFEA